MKYRVYKLGFDQSSDEMEYIPVDSPEKGMEIVLAHQGSCACLGIEERDPETDNDWEEYYFNGWDCGSLTLVDGKIQVAD